jgi:3-oxoacyl-[acyl-carrier protein] reductase
VISFEGKRALVTGGSRGIGAATAIMLANAGADVGIGFHTRAADAEAVAKRCRTLGVKAFAHPSDIGTAKGSDELAARAKKEFGGLDFFIGNAGIWPVEEAMASAMTDERWARTMKENVDGMFFSTRAALRIMSDNGRVVLVSSTAGQRGESMHADYAASKGAMISFVKSLAIETAPRGITVNSVAPGWVDTEMAAEPFAGGGRARIAKTIPIGRIATPEDIAGPIVFLCSELARHITGEIVNVNGGSVLCG